MLVTITFLSAEEWGNIFTLVGLFVYLPVNKITQNIVDRFSRNLLSKCGMTQHESIRFFDLSGSGISGVQGQFFNFPTQRDMAF